MQTIKTQPDFIHWLEGKFIDQGEVGGIPITKDNCEDMFENYLEALDPQNIMDFATNYGQEMYLIGQKDVISELQGIETTQSKVENELLNEPH
jgi:hypothetical protein